MPPLLRDRTRVFCPLRPLHSAGRCIGQSLTRDPSPWHRTLQSPFGKAGRHFTSGSESSDPGEAL